MIEVINPGIHTTIQDSGRLNNRFEGIPTSGAMDQHAYILANHLLQHTSFTPVLEFTLKGPTLFFYAETYIVLTGAEFEVKLNNTKIPHAAPVYIPAESTLEIGHVKKGNYGYLGVLNGFSADVILDSASYHTTLNPEAKLKRGQRLMYITTQFKRIDFNSRVTPVHDKLSRTRLDVYPGPEFHTLDDFTQLSLLNQQYSIHPNSNRMAIQLGDVSDVSAKEIITSPVQPGTVQLTPSGQLIVLMRDAQTTGGYARVLQLSDYAMNSLAQCEIGKSGKATFHLI